MLVFAPSSPWDSLYQPYPQPSTNPRDRYLAALAQARSAEAEYVAALVNQQAIQKQREDEQRKRVQRMEAARSQLLLDALYLHDTASPDLADPFSLYTTYAQRPVNPFETAAAAIRREVELRRAAAQRQRQEELAKQRYHALLRHKQEERERALHLAKQREQQAGANREALQHVMGLLFGEPATARPQEPVVKPQPTCSRASHGACPRQASKDRNREVQQLFKLLFDTQPVCPCAPELKEKEDQQTDSCQCQKPSVTRNTQQPKVPAQDPSTSEPSSGSSLKDQLESRLHNESQPEVYDVLKQLRSAVFGPAAKLERKERVQKRDTAPVPAPARTPAEANVATTPTAELSLKEHLEARLQKDPSVEIHDTIQAILASLSTSKDTPTRAPAKDVKPASGSASAPNSKGKGKQTRFAIFNDPTLPSLKDVVSSVDTLHNIEAAFKALSTDFSFPTRLDFSPPASPTASDADLSSTSELAYTAANAPVRYYEQALSALLSQLDAVESWGVEEVRKQRKELVERVEKALEEVEREVQVRRVQYRARSADVASNEEAVKAEESSVPQAVQVDGDTSAEETADSSPAVEVPDVVDSVPEEQSLDNEEPATVAEADVTPASVSTEENSLVDSQDTIIPANDVLPEIDTAPILASDESQASASSVDLPVAIESVEEATDSSVVHASSPEVFEIAAPAESTSPISPAVQPEVMDIITASEPEPSIPSSPQTAAEDSEPVDTFLLPYESPVLSKRPAATDDDEMVVIDKEQHGEGSDGENWSEVEA